MRYDGSIPYSLQAELTKQFELSKAVISLKELALAVNANVSMLCRDEIGGYVNAVAVDFFRGTSIVETAIFWNKRRAILEGVYRKI